MLCIMLLCFVRRRGLEPPRACAHYHLKVARLPIPPPAHGEIDTTVQTLLCLQQRRLYGALCVR